MRVAVVLLYGLYLPGHKHLQEYRNYLDAVAKDIAVEKPDRILLCGGHTDPKHADASEASTVQAYLQKTYGFANIDLEDRSITTNQNLEFAAERFGKEEDFLVYCDTARKAKAIWMALHFLFHDEPVLIYQLLLNFLNDGDLHRPFSYEHLRVKGIPYSLSEEQFLVQTYSGIL